MNSGFRDRGPGNEAPKKQGQHPGIRVAHSEEKNHEPNGQKRDRIEIDDFERGSLAVVRVPKGSKEDRGPSRNSIQSARSLPRAPPSTSPHRPDDPRDNIVVGVHGGHRLPVDGPNVITGLQPRPVGGGALPHLGNVKAGSLPGKLAGDTQSRRGLLTDVVTCPQ